MGNMTELKPCPKCKSKDIDLVSINYDRRYFYACERCGYKADECYDEEEAIEAWNRRKRKHERSDHNGLR